MFWLGLFGVIIFPLYKLYNSFVIRLIGKIANIHLFAMTGTNISYISNAERWGSTAALCVVKTSIRHEKISVGHSLFRKKEKEGKSRLTLRVTGQGGSPTKAQ